MKKSEKILLRRRGISKTGGGTVPVFPIPRGSFRECRFFPELGNFFFDFPGVFLILRGNCGSFFPRGTCGESELRVRFFFVFPRVFSRFFPRVVSVGEKYLKEKKRHSPPFFGNYGKKTKKKSPEKHPGNREHCSIYNIDIINNIKCEPKRLIASR